MEEEEDVNFEEMTLEERIKYCESVDDLVKDVEESVKAACATLNWTYESVDCELEPYMTCPFNSGHRVPERTMEKHLKRCEWNSLGYTKECKPLPDPFISEESPSSIKFDIQLQHRVLQEAKQKNPELKIGEEEKLIPQTSDRLMSDFTPDERKAMYEYVIANTIAPDIGQDIADLNKPEKPKSENAPSDTILELLAQERNLKRRRAKHRGVHTNKKSHTEVLREIVEKQMDMFKEYLAEKHGIPIPDDEENSNVEFENISRNSSSKPEYQKDVDQSERSNNSRSKYNSRDYNKDYKNSSRDYQESRSYSKGYDHSNDDYGKHESRKRDRYKSSDQYNGKRTESRRNSSNSRDRHRSENYKHRDDSDSRDKYRDNNNFRERRHNENNSREPRRDDSDSRSKRHDDDDSQGRRRENSESRGKHRDDYETVDRHRDDSGSRNKRQDEPDDSQDQCYIDGGSRSKRRDDEDNSQDNHRDDSGFQNQRLDDDDTGDGYRTGSRIKYRDEHDSRDRSYNKNNPRDYSESRDNSSSRDRKQDSSKSSKRKAPKKSKCDSKERSNHKKHKKDKKKKREKSIDREDDYGKHKVPKRNRSRSRSRSY